MAHIVVVGQTPIRQMWLTEALTGHRVTCMGTALDAVRTIVQHPTTLVIADLFEQCSSLLVEELKKLRMMVPPRVILVAEMPNDEAVAKANEATRRRGANGFIPLPTTPEEFRIRIEAALGKAKSPAPVVLRIKRMSPPPVTTEGICRLLRDAPLSCQLIERTIGWDDFHRSLSSVLMVDKPAAARWVSNSIIEWAHEESPLLWAAEFSEQYSDNSHTLAEYLLYRMVNKLLFARTTSGNTQ
ncbi:MAG: hypothetical protein V1853_00290 [bacterium]